MQSKNIFYFVLLFIFSVPLITYGPQDQQKEINSEAVSSEITIFKKPHCRCCSRWVSYLKEDGFSVTQNPSDTLSTVKDYYNVPKDLRSCHTGIIEGYVVEGHVPVESINKLLEAEPDANGIAVPGMPTGTPGMGQDGTPYRVFLFNEEGKKSVYGSYN